MTQEEKVLSDLASLLLKDNHIEADVKRAVAKLHSEGAIVKEMECILIGELMDLLYTSRIRPDYLL